MDDDRCEDQEECETQSGSMGWVVSVRLENGRTGAIRCE